jgi:hypothetical protein
MLRRRGLHGLSPQEKAGLQNRMIISAQVNGNAAFERLFFLA